MLDCFASNESAPRHQLLFVREWFLWRMNLMQRVLLLVIIKGNISSEIGRETVHLTFDIQADETNQFQHWFDSI